MTFLTWLRILADLAFYYTYAAFFVSLAGSSFSLPGLLIPSLLCALSCRFPDRKTPPAPSESGADGEGGVRFKIPEVPSVSSVHSSVRSKARSNGHLIVRSKAGEDPDLPRRLLRTALLLPALLCLLLPGCSAGDRIALIPALLYTGALAWTGGCDLSPERQQDTFLLFLRSCPVFFLLAAIFGFAENLIAASLPPALLCAALCVYLMRVLRHDSEEYTAGFLLRSGLTPLAFLGLAWILHLKPVTDAVSSVLLGIYSGFLVPILTVLLQGLTWLIAFLLSPLLALRTGEGEVPTLDSASSDAGMEELSAGGAGGSGLAAQVIRFLAAAAAAAAVCVLLFLLFRRLAGKRSAQPASGISSEERRAGILRPAKRPGMPLPSSAFHPVNQVRRQYRRYLQLCRRKGFDPYPFLTSREIERQTSPLFRDPSPARELRGLYLQARYRGTATREDAARAAELVEELTKEARNS